MRTLPPGLARTLSEGAHMVGDPWALHARLASAAADNETHDRVLPAIAGTSTDLLVQQEVSAHAHAS